MVISKNHNNISGGDVPNLADLGYKKKMPVGTFFLIWSLWIKLLE
jgi:hypothetical protein